MKWINPDDELPPQGKKILYFKEGNMYVVQRYDDMWLPIPFYDSKFAFHQAPDLWCDIIPPLGYTGKIQFIIPEDSERILDLDEFEIFYPEKYKKFIEIKRKVWEKQS